MSNLILNRNLINTGAIAKLIWIAVFISGLLRCLTNFAFNFSAIGTNAYEANTIATVFYICSVPIFILGYKGKKIFVPEVNLRSHSWKERRQKDIAFWIDFLSTMVLAELLFRMGSLISENKNSSPLHFLYFFCVGLICWAKRCPQRKPSDPPI